ncbi:MAG: DUF4062 domain-containing protein [Deltaproteobacteria bacterium]|nr:MAG: DUF4062 domain-containing protein [Deltaproteobacteria bacterium]TMQ19634.1 MAG: DUF4062 domain-containing protein [Deltaproteobacteria bacterium]
MATIYLSSTYGDLRLHREAVYRQLQRMKHVVIAMEDYVARDDRPAVACSSDVARSDLYVGLFAWRYGHIPISDNPSALSITEIEYRIAEKRGIPRLVFLLDEAAAWPPSSLDSHTGDGERGARIQALRAELAATRLASFFTSPDDLAAKVAAAVHLAAAVTDASDASFDLAAIVGQDAVDNDVLFNASYAPYLLQKLAEVGEAQLLRVDLRDGTHWWSTRLYALAALAHDYTAVEWLLFLEQGSTYVGMIRPSDLRRALASRHPEIEEQYRNAHAAPAPPGMGPHQRAAQVLSALVAQLAQHPGGESALAAVIDTAWLSKVPGLRTTRVERAGVFDPLATFQLLQETTPFVPVTAGGKLLKVIDRVGVATELARMVVERRLGRG